MSDQQSIFNSLKDEGPQAWLAYLRSFEEVNRSRVSVCC
jgi:hypothetical protein